MHLEQGGPESFLTLAAPITLISTFRLFLCLWRQNACLGDGNAHLGHRNKLQIREPKLLFQLLKHHF